MSRKQYLALDKDIYHVLTYQENEMDSAIKMKRWNSPLDKIESCKIPRFQSIDRALQTIWSDWPMGKQFEEMNQIVISLLYMLLYSLLILGLVSVWTTYRRAFRANNLLVHVMATTYIKKIDHLINEIFEMQGQSMNKKWVRMRSSKKHRHGSSKQWSRRLMVLATVLNIDEKATGIDGITTLFDTDSSSVVCNNSANRHVCNDRRMFTELRDTPMTNTVVATIGGKTSIPTGIGTVKWTWKDDSGQEHTHHLTDVLYFPTSPVNILSITALADQLNDDNGTGIDTRRRTSRLYWDNNRYEKTFLHSSSNLPEMPVNEGVSSFAWFTNACARKLNDNIQCTCCLTNKHLDRLSDKDKTGLIDSFLDIP
jgi:hypothetical protein